MIRILAALQALLPATALLAAEPPGAVVDESLIGTVVRSERWNVRRTSGTVEELSGNVVYEYEDRMARAEWARYDHESGVLEAKTDIRGRQRLRDGTTAALEGQLMTFDRRNGKGTLRGESEADPIRFSLTPPDGDGTARGSARRLVFDASKETVSLEGDIRLAAPRGDARAEDALFERRARSLTLSGRRPVLTAREAGWSAAVQAETITGRALEGSRRRVVAEGAARGWLYFPDKGRR
ncbi:MAG: hypothetical protein ABII00_06075 [Elusimicrobiota bacterium]